MAYLNIKDYQNAITYLDRFDADDVLLSALAKGAIGDAFAQLGQNDEAYEYYQKAAAASDNSFSTPKYLFKASLVGIELGKNKQALTYLQRIKTEFAQYKEAELVDVQIGRLEQLN
jgi:tetratricopeptide (TPR) repeat protein